MSETITKNDLNAILTQVIPQTNILNTFYPVGSYYETSDTSFNPNTAWGGTWVLEIAGQVHVSGATSGTYQINGALTNTSDGGSITHDHLYALQYNAFYYDVQLEGNANAGVKNYRTGNPAGSTAVSGNSTALVNGNNTQASTSVSSARYITEGYTGTESTLPPYIVVNRWHRTA